MSLVLFRNGKLFDGLSAETRDVGVLATPIDLESIDG